MPRQARMLYDGAVYHILQRGHNKGCLFREDADFEVLLEYVRKYKRIFAFDIYHYCIMSNHFHMIMRVMRGVDLPVILQGITQSYSYYYRKTRRASGYVYQNRYKSFIIEEDSYLLECGRYIERNPLRAGIVHDLRQYRWSSYNYYAYGMESDIITENPLYRGMGRTQEERRASYRQYVSEPRPYDTIIDKAMLGY